MIRSRSWTLAVAVACLAAAPAFAQVSAASDARASDSREEARALAYAGVEAYEAGDFVAADQKLRRAYSLVPVPAVGLWSARALVKLNRLVEASRRYLEVSRSSYSEGDAEVQRQAKQDAAREYAELLPRIPSVQSSTRSAEAEKPRADARERNDLWRSVGWVSVGVGGATLVGSAVAGIIAWSQLSEFDCEKEPCQGDNAGDVATYNGLRTFSTIGYIAGGVLTGAGIFLLLQHRTPHSELSFSIGPGSATLGGRF